jgi:hypothetical protein
MADLAITGLVFPLSDPQNAMAPLGADARRADGRRIHPWPYPMWLPAQLIHVRGRSRMVGRIGWTPATAAWDTLQLSIPGSVRCWSGRRRGGAMATCEVCGNDYDKAFQVTVAGATHTLTASNAPSIRWRQPASTAAAGSSAMAWRPTAACSAAPTVPSRLASSRWPTAPEPHHPVRLATKNRRQPLKAYQDLLEGRPAAAS